MPDLIDRRGLFVPNPKQWELCSTHAIEVLLSGPNQHGGKTYTLRYLIATHATGDYPPEWTGPRFDEPPVIVVLSPTHDGNRDQIVHHLFSEVFETDDLHGPGWIRPHEYDIEDLTITSQNPKNSVSVARIKHLGPDRKVNGKSMVLFTSYSAGLRRIAGLTVDLVVGNELPTLDVFSELKARIGATDGIVRIVGCPLEEEPEVYYQFKDAENPEIMQLIEYSIMDCTHISEEKIQRELARWKDHPEREARLFGRPCRGSGIIFPYPMTTFACPPAKPEPSYRLIIGIDMPLIGGTFAAVLLSWAHDTDTITAHAEFKQDAQEWSVYAHRVKLMGGDTIPVAWPKDGKIRVDPTGSETRVQRLRSLGLNMLRDPAHFWEGAKRSDSTMAMIEEAQERITTGRLKISRSCPQLIDEMRRWRAKNGKVKAAQDDHLIDAMLKGIMMKRYAKAPEQRGDGLVQPLSFSESGRFVPPGPRRIVSGDSYEFFS